MILGFTLATRFERLTALVMDGIIAVAPLIATFFVAPSLGGAAALVFPLTVAWMFFHGFLGDGLGDGQSLGKQFIGIRVIDATSGRACTFLQSFIRNVVLSALGPIDWLFIFGERRQRLGDRAAGTIVVTAA